MGRDQGWVKTVHSSIYTSVVCRKRPATDLLSKKSKSNIVSLGIIIKLLSIEAAFQNEKSPGIKQSSQPGRLRA